MQVPTINLRYNELVIFLLTFLCFYTIFLVLGVDGGNLMVVEEIEYVAVLLKCMKKC